MYPVHTSPPVTQDEKLARRLGQYTPEMLEALNDSEERDRFNRLMIKLIHAKPYLASFLVECVKHTGRAAVNLTPTACVWISPRDLAVHIAVNPFFIQSLEKVDVVRGALPLDPAAQLKMQQADYKVVTVGAPPRFVQRILADHDIPPKRDNEWIAVRLNLLQQVSILEHEVRHVLNRHTEQFMDRNQWPDAQVLNIAMDVAINQHIENLPPEAMTVEGFKNDPDHPLELPINETFNVYYELLMEFYKDADRGNIPKQQQQKAALQGFVAGTLVRTPTGEVPIQFLRKGDQVLTVDKTGKLVSRYIELVKVDTAAVIDTPERIATDMVSMKTDGGRTFDRVSNKAKVWTHAPGAYPWPGPREPFPVAAWQGIGATTMHRVSAQQALPVPPLQIGDTIWVYTPRPLGSTAPWTQEKVTHIATEPRQANEKLYQLKVQEVDNISAFFANGMFVRGITFFKPPEPPPGAEGEGPQPPPPPPSGDDDDFPIPPRGKPGGPSDEKKKPPPQDGQGERDPEDQDKEPGEPSKPGEEGDDAEPNEGDFSSSGSPDGEPTQKRKVVPAPVDDHDVWQQGPPGRIQREGVKRWVERVKQRAKQSGAWGTMPGNMKRQIEDILKPPKIDWRREFRNLVGRHIKVGHKPTRKRPSRRWGYDFPGRKTVRGARIMVAVDNSGSMTEPELRQIGAETADMLKRGVEVVLVVWDTEIVSVDLVKKPWQVEEIFANIGGGGGTNVGIVFDALANPDERLLPEAAALFRKRPDLLAIFTDGDLAWPDPGANQGIPTLWGITRAHNLDKPKFGIVLHVDVGLD